MTVLSAGHPEVRPSLPLLLELAAYKQSASWVQKYRKEKKKKAVEGRASLR